MDKRSYENKLDPMAFGILIIFVVLAELIKENKENVLELVPEFYEKYEKEGCPDWARMYGSKIKLHKLMEVCQKALPSDLINLGKKVDLKNLNHRLNLRIIALYKKHGDEILEKLFIGLWRKKITVLLGCYVLLHISLFPALFGEHFANLIKKAKSDDRDSILKLVQVDKSFIGKNWALKEVRKAQLSGDTGFLNKLGNALKKHPLKSKKKNLSLSMFLVMGWELGLKKLKINEIHDLVTDMRIYDNDDPDNLYKEIKRLKLRKNRGLKEKRLKTKRDNKK